MGLLWIIALGCAAWMLVGAACYWVMFGRPSRGAIRENALNILIIAAFWPIAFYLVVGPALWYKITHRKEIAEAWRDEARRPGFPPPPPLSAYKKTDET